MRLLRSCAVALLAVAVFGCASTPAPAPPPFVLTLAPTPRPDVDAPVQRPPLRVEDERDVPDRTRIGEEHAPGGGMAPPTAAGGAVALGGVAAMMVLPPQPTGRYLTVVDAVEVAHAVERTLAHALARSPRRAMQDGLLEVTVRTFWIRPSWTTTCDVVADVRVRGPSGAVRWERTLAGHGEKFEGWFTTGAFERVARMALDQLGEIAAAAFASDEFGAALATGR